MTVMIEIGRSLSGPRRTVLESMIREAIEILARCVGTDVRGFALGKTLTVSVGTQRYRAALGRRVPAAYLSDQHVIATTMTQGCSHVPLAHEWAHALERSLRARGATPTVESLIGELKHWPTDGRFVLECYRGTVRDQGAEAGNAFAAGGWRTDEAIARWGSSAYYNDALDLDADEGGVRYWARDGELLARSFEAWIHERIGQAKRHLVSDDAKARPSRGYPPRPYPQRWCRGRAVEQWDRLIQSIVWTPAGPTVGMPASGLAGARERGIEHTLARETRAQGKAVAPPETNTPRRAGTRDAQSATIRRSPSNRIGA